MDEDRILTATSLKKIYGSFVAADVPELHVNKGEFFTIVGPSGSGKSTLLSMLTGTTLPSSGKVEIRGQDVTFLPPERRPTTMVFQNLALFPHMSVGQNIGFPMDVRGTDEAKKRARVMSLLELVHLPTSYYDKAIAQCSGGERQRIAIARALANDSEIIFFDEPLSAIDYRLRKTLEVELMEMHRHTGKTFVYVTHSLEEAMTMSDRLTIMKNGKIVQTGTANDIYTRPQNEFVAQFLGEINVFTVQVINRNDRKLTLSSTESGGNFTAVVPKGHEIGNTAKLVVRPENMRILRDGENCDNAIEAIVSHRLMLGSRIQYEAEAFGKRLIIEELSKVDVDSASLAVGAGDRIRVGWSSDGGILVDD
ncbi:ABC transporter ATP-binding protein [Nitratireductor soli]|uniref:ABC transporter ATP-binding protein n=1 Tax=Nitratireductor soli TaxID=1670619 RepID=UPI00069FF2E5|nr:ABC transporter ATP-binding protein [Nitratireductor soli]